MKPFIKTVGGKLSIYSGISQYFPDPDKYGTYIEPFLGGGAVLLTLRPSRAIVADINKPLVNSYVQIRDNPYSLLEILDELGNHLSKDDYLEQRCRFNEDTQAETPEKAAQFIYLNKIGFNGLFRVNKSGRFNVPYGGERRKSALFDRTNILEISEYLKNNDIQIMCADFRQIVKFADLNSFTFLDPPYLVKEGSFTSYHESGFTRRDYTDMVAIARHHSACTVITNSMNDPELFSGFTQHTIQRRTSVSGYNKARVASPEYVYVLDRLDDETEGGFPVR